MSALSEFCRSFVGVFFVTLFMLCALFVHESFGQQPDPRNQALANLRTDVMALETQLRHVEDSIAALDGQSQRDLAMLADKAAWWQECASGKIDWPDVCAPKK